MWLCLHIKVYIQIHMYVNLQCTNMYVCKNTYVLKKYLYSLTIHIYKHYNYFIVRSLCCSCQAISVVIYVV